MGMSDADGTATFRKRRPQLRKRRLSSGSEGDTAPNVLHADVAPCDPSAQEDVGEDAMGSEEPTDDGFDVAVPAPAVEDTVGGVRRRRLVLEAVKELQRVRRRPQGLSATLLARGARQKAGGVAAATEAAAAEDDSWRPARGGMLNLANVSQDLSCAEQEELFGAKFAGETNRRDEDADMLKFIDAELAKRRKVPGAAPTEDASGAAAGDAAAADPLAEVADMLKPSIQQRKEDMMSQQMLTGIPEVELGIHSKIRNIEATEEAKQRLLAERLAAAAAARLAVANGSGADFVPSNMAACFVQHERWKAPSSDRAARFGGGRGASGGGGGGSEQHERTRLERERASDDVLVRQFKSRQAALGRGRGGSKR